MATLKDVMTSNVETATTDDTIETLAKKMEEQDVGDLPIIGDNKIAGLVTDRDLVIRALAKGAQPGSMKAEEVMTKEVITASPDTDTEEGIRLMGKHQIKRLLIAENNELKGVVSIKDLATDDRTKQLVDEVENDIKKNNH